MEKRHRPFSPIKNERVSEQIENRIKQAIFNKTFKVGDKIPSERELAEMFGCSRLSVREALRSLQKSGMLVIKKGVTGGGYVIPNSGAPVVESLKDMLLLGQVEIDEIAEARLAIEPTVCALAAKKATARDIRHLEEINERLRDAFHTGDPLTENDPQIHTAIADISGNRVFAIIIKSLMEIHAYRMQTIKLDDKAKKNILSYHEEIIQALGDRDTKMAFEYMRKHVMSVRDSLKRLDKKKRGAPPHGG